ncbi:GNAT family N-acetyltransferase [Protofrankia symbiont of Coriaria ruscifolia]|uniref:GNAT family N-acetyltransferase n=1 Tax=Protofrankia symbiont of Coriaria ruscifolia TaxID=1306542 RepID=UPI001F5E8851|nr:GNAT family N-acetyltransferase [Protofrankia symbiont of Coriaria ruscifolia]
MSGEPAAVFTIPTIATERLTLRAITPGDLDAYAAMWADPEFMRHLGGPAARAVAWRNMATALGHWALWGYGQWSVVETATGELVGRAGLWNEPGWPGVEVTWFIGRPHWGRGFAMETGRATLRFAFEHLTVDQLVFVIDAGNTPSIRVAEKIGATYLRTEYLHGKDQEVYVITRAEWETRTGG